MKTDPEVIRLGKTLQEHINDPHLFKHLERILKEEKLWNTPMCKKMVSQTLQCKSKEDAKGVICNTILFCEGLGGDGTHLLDAKFCHRKDMKAGWWDGGC